MKQRIEYNIEPLQIITMPLSFNTLVGISASVFTSISLLPQLIKLLKEKKAESISVWMLFILFTGLGQWIYYGY